LETDIATAIHRAVARRIATWLLPALLAAPAQAAHSDAVTHLRIVGGLAGLRPYTHLEEPFWTRELPRLSGGRVTADIVPFDRAGLRGPEILELVRIGAVPFGTALLSASAHRDPAFAAPDLAGLNADLAELRRNLTAFRPWLQATLRTRYDAELLALYVYPAQVTFCSRPLQGLGDLKGRRVRVSSPSQADFVQALGALPVTTPFSEIVSNLRNGSVECAITGTMSGNTIGLHELTSHVHTMPVGWGVAAFVANRAALKALPADLQALLQQELPRLEQAVWKASANETDEGTACNVGEATCTHGRKGRMVAVPESAADARRRREVFEGHVLPRWFERCGPTCEGVWKHTIGALPALAGAAR
jgi:TRAP-type C4-dicarboxylate transport system substrate-binding protein